MILVSVRDLLFASKIDAAAKRLDVEVAWSPRDRPLDAVAEELKPACVLADLNEPGAVEMLRSVKARAPETRLIGFLGHLQTDLMDQSRSLGVEVFTRGQLSARLDDILLRASRRAP